MLKAERQQAGRDAWRARWEGCRVGKVQGEHAYRETEPQREARCRGTS